MPVYPRESQLEKYIKDFAYHNTAEVVELHLTDDVIIRPVSRKGSIILGIFWSNVLQCDRNFPPYPYVYKKQYDSELKEEKLMVTVDNVTFTVYLKTGTFVISGKYIYEWFTKNFRNMMENFDLQFGEKWQYEATIDEVVPPYDDGSDRVDDPYTETEEYLLFRNKEHKYYKDIDRKLEEGTEDLVKGIGNLNIDHQVFSKEDLSAELDGMKQGCVKDGMAVVYKTWKSLLDRWFATEGAEIYLSSPMLDSQRLKDIIELYLKHRALGQLKVFYLQQNADPVNGKSATDVKKAATSKLDDKVQTFVQYRLLRKMVYPANPTHAVYVAGVFNGQAEVFVTSANFHGSYFVSGSSQMVMYLQMSEEEFLKKYVEILEVPNVATSY